jgi:hypothetical protein
VCRRTEVPRCEYFEYPIGYEGATARTGRGGCVATGCATSKRTPAPRSPGTPRSASHTSNGLRSVVSGRHCVANAATGCNNLRSVATNGTALQPVALLVCCSGSHCVAIIAATGCNGLWSVATGDTALRSLHRLQRAVAHGSELWSVATGCAALRRAGLLRHTLYCEQRCNRLQRAVVYCNGSHSIAIAATGCKGLWSVATDGTLLQPAALRCNGLQQVATGCGLL